MRSWTRRRRKTTTTVPATCGVFSALKEYLRQRRSCTNVSKSFWEWSRSFQSPSGVCVASHQAYWSLSIVLPIQSLLRLVVSVNFFLFSFLPSILSLPRAAFTWTWQRLSSLVCTCVPRSFSRLAWFLNLDFSSVFSQTDDGVDAERFCPIFSINWTSLLRLLERFLNNFVNPGIKDYKTLFLFPLLFDAKVCVVSRGISKEAEQSTVTAMRKCRCTDVPEIETLRFQVCTDAEIKTVPSHFARANQADRCINLLHCVQRSTPWLLDTRGVWPQSWVLFFVWAVRDNLTLPVGTWLSALDQSFRSQSDRLRTSQSHYFVLHGKRNKLFR